MAGSDGAFLFLKHASKVSTRRRYGCGKSGETTPPVELAYTMSGKDTLLVPCREIYPSIHPSINPSIHPPHPIPQQITSTHRDETLQSPLYNVAPTIPTKGEAVSLTLAICIDSPFPPGALFHFLLWRESGTSLLSRTLV